MAERITKVRLTAQVADYIKSMDEAASKTSEVGEALSKLDAQKKVFDTLGKAGIAAGGGIAAIATIAVAKASDFNQAMSFVKATGADAVENFTDLRQAALDAGAATVFSATESANAIEEMAKAGVDAKDILGGGLDGALDLAAAGGLGVADAAGIAAVALKTFKLEGSDMAHVADLLAAGAGKAMGDVSDLSQALAQGGQVAAATGLSIEETTAALSAFASQGLLGSDAGTSLKTMLQRLTPQSKEAADKFKELGISAYDANGQFVGLANFSGQLKERMKDLTPEARNAAMAVMFGSDAVRGANVLYSEGEKGMLAWIKRLNEQGYATETARTRLDNLKGDWEAFTGALDTAFIVMGDGVDGPLREFVQGLTGLVDGYNELPQWAQQLIQVSGAAVGLIAGVGGASLLAIPKIVEFRQALTAMNTSFSRVTLVGGGITVALAAVAGVVLSLANAQAEGRQKAEDYMATLEDGTRRVTSATRDQVKAALAAQSALGSYGGKSAYDAAEKLGLGLDLVTEAALGNADAIAQVQAATEEYMAYSGSKSPQRREQLLAAQQIRDGVKGEADSIEEAKRMAEQKAAADAKLTEATGEATDASKSAAQAYIDESDAASALSSELNNLLDTLNKANGVGQDAISQNIKYQDALRGVEERMQQVHDGAEGYGYGLDASTDAGARNMEMLVDLARTSWDAAGAQYQLDGSTDGLRQRMEEGRQKLIDYATELTGSAEEAAKLADEIYGIPGEKEFELIAQTEQARWTLDDFIANYGTLAGVINYRATLPDLNGDTSGSGRMGTFYDGGILEAFADGGFPSGVYKGVQGGIHKFAEAEMGVPWEAYISGRPSSRDRNVGVWMDAGQKLGVLGPSGETKNVSVSQTFVLPQGITPGDVERISAERAATAVRSA